MKTALVLCQPYPNQISEQFPSSQFDYYAVDSGLITYYEQKTTCQLAVGDFDSITDFDSFCQKIKTSNLVNMMIQLDPHKDDTDLEHLLLQKQIAQYDRILCYTKGFRWDHLLRNIQLLNQYPQVYLFDDYNFVFVLNAHDNYFTHDKNPASEVNVKRNWKYVSFIALKKTNIKINNLAYSYQGEITADQPFISNEFITKPPVKAKITVDTPGNVICIFSNLE